MTTLELDTRKLERYLLAHIPEFKGPLNAEKFAGGQSNPTYLLSSASGRYVLRRKPPGELLKSAHAVDWEFRVMSALASTAVPVPNMRVLCEDDSIIGSMFYVMDFVEGRIFWNAALPEQTNRCTPGSSASRPACAEISSPAEAGTGWPSSDSTSQP